MSYCSSKLFTRSACSLLLMVASAECFAQTPAMAEGVRAIYQGDHRRAAELAEKRLRKYPNDAPARVILARAALAQGEIQRGDQELPKAPGSEPPQHESPLS